MVIERYRRVEDMTRAHGDCCTPWKRSSGFSNTSVNEYGFLVPCICDLYPTIAKRISTDWTKRLLHAEGRWHLQVAEFGEGEVITIVLVHDGSTEASCMKIRESVVQCETKELGVAKLGRPDTVKLGGCTDQERFRSAQAAHPHGRLSHFLDVSRLNTLSSPRT